MTQAWQWALRAALFVLIGPLLAAVTVLLFTVALAILLLAFLVSIPAFVVVLFGFSVYLQVQALWHMPRIPGWIASLFAPRAPRDPGDFPIRWSGAVGIADEDLVRALDYQLNEINNHTFELLGLYAFGATITAAAIALAEGTHGWAWGTSLGLVGLMAVFGAAALSAYRPRPSTTVLSDPTDGVVVALRLGQPIDANALRAEVFRAHLVDAMFNARAIEARRRLLMFGRAVVAIVIALLVLIPVT